MHKEIECLALALSIIAGRSEVCVTSAEEAFGLYESCGEMLKSNTGSNHSRWVQVSTHSLPFFKIRLIGETYDSHGANFPLSCSQLNALMKIWTHTHLCAGIFLITAGLFSRLSFSLTEFILPHTVVTLFSLYIQLPVLSSCGEEGTLAGEAGGGGEGAGERGREGGR